MARTFVIGDPHGRDEAASDVLRKAHFNYNKDTLIILGDVVDGGRHTRELIDIFLKVKNRIFVYGNHDIWAQGWYNHGNQDPHEYNWYLPEWIHQGGHATLESYEGKWENIPQSHIEFMNSGVFYYIDENNNLFVHGGLNPDKPIKQQKFYDLMWDRNIIEFARYQPIPGYNLVFIGHTTVAHALCDAGIKREEITRESLVPLRLNNLIMMDTGAGWDGQMSLMNVKTLEYWQSSKGINRPHNWAWC